MALLASVGLSQLLDGREAGSEAARKAFDSLDRGPATFAFVVASHDYPLEETIGGVSALLSDTPLLGFSAGAVLSGEGSSQRAVAVALMSSSDVQVRADWWHCPENGHTDTIHQSVQTLLQGLRPEEAPGTLLVVYDGLAVYADKTIEAIQEALKRGDEGEKSPVILTGCLSGGDLRSGRTFQVGGRQSGSGGMAGAFLSGKISAGVGAGSGWHPAGPYFKATRVSSAGGVVSLRGLDGQAPAEIYTKTLGRSADEWCRPPLNELVRLYPLGYEVPLHGAHEKTARVRSPLCVESDGSLRMNASIRERSTLHLLAGSVAACLQAAEDAARQALDHLAQSNLAQTDLAQTELGQYGLAQRQAQVKPALALLLVDAAWQMQMEACPGEEIKAVQNVLGKDIPLIGGYTFGQIGPLAQGESAELLNQHLLLVLLGETG